MNSSWISTTIGGFLTLQRGHDLTASERRDGHIPVMGAAGQNGCHDTAKANGPGIVVGRSGGSFGQVHFCRSDFWPHNTALYVSDYKGNDIYYAYYLLKNLDFNRLNSGSAQPSLNRNFVHPIRIRIPLPDEQRKIASILTNLDAKIELNHRINQELEGLAKLLYDYWFVQFDFPISAEQAAAMGDPTLQGKPYRQSGGKMTYNPTLKRDIPEGWDVGCLPDIATFTNGIACQKYPADGGDTLRVIKIKEMRDGLTADSDIVTSSVPEKVKIDDGDLLFSWSASLEVMIWSGGKGALNQHIFKVTSDSHPRSFCYFTLLDYLKHFQMMADLRKTTMGHITKEHLDQSRIALPPAWLTDQFEQVVNPLIERMLKSHAEIQELATLRDWLLPMLMNGQVTVAH